VSHLPGRVVHLELHTGARDDARAFYAELCGWRPQEIRTSSGCYLALRMGGELGGGVVQCPVARPLWLPYVQVSSVEEVMHRAQQLGATVLLEPREGPAGWRSVVATPAAGEIAFWQPKR
jgi:predicted enzyme related to lactoylglutathione lyase